MTKQELQEELKQSMLKKEEVKTSVLRMLLSAITYFEIQKGGAGYQATPEDVLSVLEKQIKQRRESIELYKQGGRQDLAQKEEKELEILKTYLPEQMSEEDIHALIKQTIDETEAKSIQDMGKVMKALMAKLKGKADASLVSNIVRQKLSS